jgi:hypothetical protein
MANTASAAWRHSIKIKAGNEPIDTLRLRTLRALQSARKYNLVANSVKTGILIKPEFEVT